MLKPIQALGAVALSLALVPSAQAADPITSVFKGAPSPVTCTTQSAAGIAGERYCQGAYNVPAQTGLPANVATIPTTVPSWDGTPIDVSVILPPAPASGPDGKFPVVGVYHGYGGMKITGTQAPTASDAAQRWVSQGYAVFSITDRGFWASCGALVPSKPSSCAKGYINLMSNAYEVRDAQYLMGQLADEGVIDPAKIGATGGSYGGGMSVQLGALKNRIQLPDGSYQPWTSPQGTPMAIAATVPEYGWTDLVSSLMPNGSTLDYASNNSYTGPGNDRRFGIQKQLFNAQLYGGGAQAGYYSAPGADPRADITAWNVFNNTGGPYDGSPVAAAQVAEFPFHGAMGTDDSVAPSPALLVNGWNDDLFPVNEAVRYYNKIRANHPDAPMSMYHLSIGHSPRSGGLPNTADATGLYGAEYAWMDYFVKKTGLSSKPNNAAGGVTITTSACNGTATKAGLSYSAKNWATLSPGEVRVDGDASQTVAANTTPAVDFQSNPATTVCTEQPSADTAGSATYSTPAAAAGGYTIAGSPTVVADLTVAGANDAVISRLYDVDPGAGTEKLIARGVYRPTAVGTSRQVFQLYPQAYAVAEGHVVKLELLGRDAPYVRASTGQNPFDVKNLQLRIPTLDQPGTAGGLVKAPAERVLPAGYKLAADLVTETKSGGDTPGVNPPAVVPIPTPTVIKDPVAIGTVRTALLKKPTKVRYTGKSLRFTEKALEPGTFTYRARISYGSGKGKKRKTVVRTLGTATVKVTKAGDTQVTLKISKTGRRLLKAHRTARIRLETQFVTGAEGLQIDTVRKFKR